MSAISPREVRYSNLSLVDDVGRVFNWKNGIYRGINPTAARQVRELLASEFMEELTRRGLFPESKITEHTLEGFAFVVEHQAIPYVTYPHEWAFDMFKDAALAVLEVWCAAASSAPSRLPLPEQPEPAGRCRSWSGSWLP